MAAGLSIIAGCKARTGDIWQAHYGAAAIASVSFRWDNRLAPGTADAVARQTEAMLAVYAPQAEDGAAIAAHEAEQAIVRALGETLEGLHWVGHNFIYAAHALSALRELGGWGTAEDIAGIASLLRSFRGTIPGRSWIGYRVSEVKKLSASEEISALSAAIDGPAALSGLVLSELAAFKRIYRAEAHHDLIGHMLTFSHALNLLHDLGREELFRAGLPQLLAIAAVLRTSRDLGMEKPIRLMSPVDRLPLELARRSEWLPAEAAFWLRDFAAIDWDFGHVFKFACSFYDHSNRAACTAHGGAEDNFRFLLPT
ncbi:hypothetical protein GT003_16905 [Paenibacillus sacheonensis]|uniref:Uncharacterized protein n=1 Tax=Paenibacillus sacheonensis TaxID=742054 RepID=A0A7X5BXM8_9BACL|nr:hypothetical protein [Paenibacillus sacheonensis]